MSEPVAGVTGAYPGTIVGTAGRARAGVRCRSFAGGLPDSPASDPRPATDYLDNAATTQKPKAVLDALATTTRPAMRTCIAACTC